MLVASGFPLCTILHASAYNGLEHTRGISTQNEALLLHRGTIAFGDTLAISFEIFGGKWVTIHMILEPTKGFGGFLCHGD